MPSFIELKTVTRVNDSTIHAKQGQHHMPQSGDRGLKTIITKEIRLVNDVKNRFTKTSEEVSAITLQNRAENF